MVCGEFIQDLPMDDSITTPTFPFMQRLASYSATDGSHFEKIFASAPMIRADARKTGAEALVRFLTEFKAFALK